MRVSRLLQGLLLWPLLFISTPGMAVGLGELQTDTRLGQKLVVTIPITLGGASINLDELKANLNTRHKDSVKESDRYRVHYTFKVKIVELPDAGANGKHAYFIEIRSEQAIAEPYVSLPVHLSWPGGMLRREYTVLFD